MIGLAGSPPLLSAWSYADGISIDWTVVLGGGGRWWGCSGLSLISRCCQLILWLPVCVWRPQQEAATGGALSKGGRATHRKGWFLLIKHKLQLAQVHRCNFTCLAFGQIDFPQHPLNTWQTLWYPALPSVTAPPPTDGPTQEARPSRSSAKIQSPPKGSSIIRPAVGEAVLGGRRRRLERRGPYNS